MSRSPAQEAQLEQVWEASRNRTTARIEDLEFLVAGGVSITEAVQRCGWTLAGAARALHRRKHPLGRPVSREEWHARRAE